MHTALIPTLHIFCEVGSHWHQWLWWRGGLFKPHQGWRPILRLTSDSRFTSDSRSPFKFVNIEWTWTLLEKIKFLGQTEPRFKSCHQHFRVPLRKSFAFSEPPFFSWKMTTIRIGSHSSCIGFLFPWASQPHSHLRAFANAVPLAWNRLPPTCHVICLPLNISLLGEAFPGHSL